MIEYNLKIPCSERQNNTEFCVFKLTKRRSLVNGMYEKWFSFCSWMLKHYVEHVTDWDILKLCTLSNEILFQLACTMLKIYWLNHTGRKKTMVALWTKNYGLSILFTNFILVQQISKCQSTNNTDAIIIWLIEY